MTFRETGLTQYLMAKLTILSLVCLNSWESDLFGAPSGDTYKDSMPPIANQSKGYATLSDTGRNHALHVFANKRPFNVVTN
jgi:hypothetical protein